MLQLQNAWCTNGDLYGAIVNRWHVVRPVQGDSVGAVCWRDVSSIQGRRHAFSDGRYRRLLLSGGVLIPLAISQEDIAAMAGEYKSDLE